MTGEAGEIGIYHERVDLGLIVGLRSLNREIKRRRGKKEEENNNKKKEKKSMPVLIEIIHRHLADCRDAGCDVRERRLLCLSNENLVTGQHSKIFLLYQQTILSWVVTAT